MAPHAHIAARSSSFCEGAGPEEHEIHGRARRKTLIYFAWQEPCNIRGTMKQVSTDSRPPRGSLLNCPRLVAAADPLLDYWTDFGRLIT